MSTQTYDVEADRRRARAALNRGPAAAAARLRDELAWYRERAADPTTAPADRALWQQLADELGHRLEGTGPRAQRDLFGGVA